MTLTSCINQVLGQNFKTFHEILYSRKSPIFDLAVKKVKKKIQCLFLNNPGSIGVPIDTYQV